MNRNRTIEDKNGGSWSNMNGTLDTKQKCVKERNKLIDYSIRNKLLGKKDAKWYTLFRVDTNLNTK